VGRNSRARRELFGQPVPSPVRIALVALAAALPVAAGAAADRPQAGRSAVGQNPCLADAELRCPDLRMKRPFGLRLERRGSRTVLRAGNSIDSVGAGPAELLGVRMRGPWMRGRQRIYTRGGGRVGVTSGARLFFKRAHGGRRYWKFWNAARFELWRLDGSGRRVKRVRRGPKVSYCLRDLRRTHRRMLGSPRRAAYPACSTNPRRRRVTLGTSVGWSDIYPPTYPEQWIDVTGLRGCFAYVHIADPLDGIHESNEDNNEAQVVVRLPYRRGRQHCPGHGSGEVNREYGPY
jgi:hypothetical protein